MRSRKKVSYKKHAMRSYKKYILPALLALMFVLISKFTSGLLFLVIAYGIIIVVGALLLAWSAESLEFIVSQGLALAMIAWLQVLPEFMIEATIAWAQDVPNMLANFTGANRILMGVGWPLVYFTTLFFSWKSPSSKPVKVIKLKEEHSIEIISLAIPTLYFFIVYLKHSITILDGLVLLLMYASYLYIVRKLPHLSRKKNIKTITTIPRAILSMNKSNKFRNIVLAFMFLIGGAAIIFIADPFYKSMLALATSLGVSQFIFIQWIAPFLSEFPEKTSAFYWAKHIKLAPMAIMNLISSKIAQWTALLGLIPFVYSLSLGRVSFVPVSDFLSTELLLSIATTLYAVIILMKLRFHLLEALSLFVLWITQFLFVDLRPMITIVYFTLIGIEIAIYRKEINRAPLSYLKMFKRYVLKSK